MAYYYTIAGDTWDLIAHRALGNAMLMDRIIAENPKYCETFIFPAGVKLNVPEEIEQSERVIPPWFT